ncbi:hypothetical protein SAMN05660710_01561 [Paracoccus tibetensis]|uniref:Uncharacterized protein n=1 Tax=Paracoccus tibetensis TaxID=336292 RepID=A0A1G5FTU8_9RHOB|nr:hypothetical protein SAMN05660710_01561 [Paracoccus tibetensis]
MSSCYGVAHGKPDTERQLGEIHEAGDRFQLRGTCDQASADHVIALRQGLIWKREKREGEALSRIGGLSSAISWDQVDTRLPVPLQRGDLQCGSSASGSRAAPSIVFLNGELVALERLVPADQPVRHGQDDRFLPAGHPSGVRIRKIRDAQDASVIKGHGAGTIGLFQIQVTPLTPRRMASSDRRRTTVSPIAIFFCRKLNPVTSGMLSRPGMVRRSPSALAQADHLVAVRPSDDPRSCVRTRFRRP